MNSPDPYERYPIDEAVELIYQGEDPWYALGCFLHDWWCHGGEDRRGLITEQPKDPSTPQGIQWVAFCAAVVEELCLRTDTPFPNWIHSPQYVLSEPWYMSSPMAQSARLRETSPGPFKRRNIFVDSSVLDNKYEFAKTYSKPGVLPLWTEEEMQRLYTAEQA
jgi:hypothetical protein